VKGHGNVTLNWHGDVLVGRYSGSFNLEGLEIARQSTYQYLDSVDFNTWYRIIIYDADAYASPEVIALAHSNEEQDITLGCLGIVRVTSSELQRGIFKSLQPDGSRAFIFVNTLEQAFIEIAKMKANHLAKDC